ncbi:MAG: peptidylprolyl isomerase [Planctomycetota bacterium]
MPYPSSTPRFTPPALATVSVLLAVALASAASAQATAPATAPDVPATAPATQPAQANPIAIINTNKGVIRVELLADAAPKTVANFIGLATGTKTFTNPASGEPMKGKFYDGLVFHRVIPNFMIQGGDPLGTGRGNPGFQFEDEIDADALGLNEVKAFDENGQPNPVLGIRSQQQFQQTVILPVYRELGITSQATFDQKKDQLQARVDALIATGTVKDVLELQGYQYIEGLPSQKPLRGMLAMANAGPNTNGSQFFINVADTPWLAGKHTVFGRVLEGMEVVDAISTVPTDRENRPNEPVVIDSVVIE